MKFEYDLEKVSSKMALIISNLDKLKILKQIPGKNFEEDFRNVESAKHLLQVTIEAMHDIANHIVSRNRLGRPDTYSDVFRILRQKGYISKDSMDVYSTMIKFRNRVVHLYHDIDSKEIYSIIQNNLKDFAKFLEEIRLIIEKSGD
ncbi:MAG: type VII toxin-antitoxin system HepT family RNase toxin [Clostridia bacterium]|jgi:uncharacterized protein YutE (UPF0331/DUF86 family)|nr:DUF86 domain-containing protein [Clostridiales bacterium]